MPRGGSRRLRYERCRIVVVGSPSFRNATILARRERWILAACQTAIVSISRSTNRRDVPGEDRLESRVGPRWILEQRDVETQSPVPPPVPIASAYITTPKTAVHSQDVSNLLSLREIAQDLQRKLPQRTRTHSHPHQTRDCSTISDDELTRKGETREGEEGLEGVVLDLLHLVVSNTERGPEGLGLRE